MSDAFDVHVRVPSGRCLSMSASPGERLGELSARVASQLGVAEDVGAVVLLSRKGVLRATGRVSDPEGEELSVFVRKLTVIQELEGDAGRIQVLCGRRPRSGWQDLLRTV